MSTSRAAEEGSYAEGAPSEHVVAAVAAATGRDSMELPPLYRAVDPDALDRLVGSAGTDGAVARVEFDYAECAVTVAGDGSVSVDR